MTVWLAGNLGAVLTFAIEKRRPSQLGLEGNEVCITGC